MGILNPLVTLVDATPYRLRYLCTTRGGGPALFVIPNALGATPDLRTDALTSPAASGLSLLSRALTTAVTNAAQARKVLCNDDTSALPAQAVVDGYRARIKITPRRPTVAGVGDNAWDRIACDANEGLAAGSAPSTGFAVVVYARSAQAQGQASVYIDIELIHTKIDSQ